MDNPRKLAHSSLIKSDTQECYTNIEINTVLSRASLEKSDAALYTLLYLGVMEKRLLLDKIICQYSTLPIEKIDTEALNALRLGIYQLLYTDRIPDYSAVDESVNLAPKRAKGFVNGVLRSFIRNGKAVSYPENSWERLSWESCVPLEIMEIFKASYGEQTASELLSCAKPFSELSLRVNTLKTTEGEVMAMLKDKGYESESSKIARGIVKCAAPISDIKEIIDTGYAFVQDESSRVCSLVLGAQPGERIADTCASPGGKTFSMAIDMKNEGEIIASDLHKNKLSLIEKGAKRLGINIISTKEQNAKEYVPEYEGSFDRVLCDVPCSGLGVIFKKPDIKYKSTKGMAQLPSVQYAILSNVSKYVKNGGILVYSTCTLCSSENEENIKRFLKENSDFEPLDFKVGDIVSKDGMYTFFPHVTGTDGFFVAKLRRVK